MNATIMKGERSKLLAAVAVLAMVVCAFVAFMPADAVNAEPDTTMPTAENGIITLSNDVTLSETYTIPEDVTKIDLGGFTITCTSAGTGIIIPENVDVTIDNGVITTAVTDTQIDAIVVLGTATLGSDLTISVTGEFSWDAPYFSGALTLFGGDVTINGSTITSAFTGITLYNSLYNEPGAAQADINQSESSILTVNDGSFTAGFYTISGNNQYSAGSVIDINGGEFKSTVDTEGCFYLPMECTVTIDDAKVEGATAIGIRMGSLTITNSEITATGKATDYDGTGSGFSANGSAIIVLSQFYGTSAGMYKENPDLVVTINEGTSVTSENNSSVDIVNGGINAADVQDATVSVNTPVDSVRVINAADKAPAASVGIQLDDVKSLTFTGIADVTLNGETTIENVSVGTGSSLTIGKDGDVTVPEGKTIAGPITNNGILENFGTVSGKVTNNGTIYSSTTISTAEGSTGTSQPYVITSNDAVYNGMDQRVSAEIKVNSSVWSSYTVVGTYIINDPMATGDDRYTQYGKEVRPEGYSACIVVNYFDVSSGSTKTNVEIPFTWYITPYTITEDDFSINGQYRGDEFTENIQVDNAFIPADELVFGTPVEDDNSQTISVTISVDNVNYQGSVTFTSSISDWYAAANSLNAYADGLWSEVPGSDMTWYEASAEIQAANYAGFLAIWNTTNTTDLAAALEQAKAGLLAPVQEQALYYLETAYNGGEPYYDLIMSTEIYNDAVAAINAAETPRQAIDAYTGALGQRSDLNGYKQAASDEFTAFVGGSEALGGVIPGSDMLWIDLVYDTVLQAYSDIWAAENPDAVTAVVDTAEAEIMSVLQERIAYYLETAYNNGEPYYGLIMTEEQYNAAVESAAAATTPEEIIGIYNDAVNSRGEAVTVTFMNGDEEFAVVSVVKGSAVTLESTPTKASDEKYYYVFQFWTADLTADPVTEADLSAVPSDMTVYAYYKAEKLVEPTVSIDGMPISFQVGVEYVFTVSTTAGSFLGTMVKGEGQFYNPDLYDVYYLTDSNEWALLEENAFGPASGFPLSDATSYFKVVFKQACVFDLTVSIADMDGNVLCDDTQKVIAIGTGTQDRTPRQQADYELDYAIDGDKLLVYILATAETSDPSLYYNPYAETYIQVTEITYDGDSMSSETTNYELRMVNNTTIGYLDDRLILAVYEIDAPAVDETYIAGYANWDGMKYFPIQNELYFGAATGITVDPEIADLEIGETQQLTATVTPEDAIDTSVIWSTSDEAVATVNENGLVTAVGEGTATITATTANGLTDTCIVTVTEPLTLLSIEVTAPDMSYYLGDILDTSGIVVTAYYNHDIVRTIDIADCTISGNVIGTDNQLVLAGVQTVTVSYGGFSGTFDVTVGALETISLRVPLSLTFEVGDSISMADLVGLGFEVVADYSNGLESRDVSELPGCTLVPTEFTTAGEIDITVTYVEPVSGNSASATFSVTVTEQTTDTDEPVVP